jgi:prepilin-type processing-associated H-X9-DG protein
VIGQAISLYVEDFDKFPVFRQTASKGKDPTKWHSVFWDDLLGMGYDGRNLSVEQADKWLLKGSELAGSEIYACPLDDGDIRTAEIPGKFKGLLDGQKNGMPRSYGLNSYRSWAGMRDEQKEGISGIKYQSISGINQFLTWSQDAHRIPAPSEMILIAESPGTGYVGGGGSALRGSPYQQDGNGDVKYFKSIGFNIDEFTNIRFHNRGYNYLFVDGHVENLLPEDTIAKDGAYNDPKGGLWTLNPND